MRNMHLYKKVVNKFMKENGLGFDEEFMVADGCGTYKYKLTKGYILFLENCNGIFQECNKMELCRIMFDDRYEIIKPTGKLKNGEEYWYIRTEGETCHSYFLTDNVYDCASFLIGNCFRTREKAEKNKEKVLKLLNRKEPLVNLDEM